METPVVLAPALPAVLFVSPAKEPVTKRAEKKTQKRTRAAVSRRRTPAPPSKEILRQQRFLETELSLVDNENREGTNSLSLEDEALELALDTNAPANDLGDLRTSETQVEVEFHVGGGQDLEVPYVEKIGAIVANGFEGLRESLEAIKNDPLVSPSFVGFTKPEITRPSKPLKKRTPKPAKQVVQAPMVPVPQAAPKAARTTGTLNLGPQFASLGLPSEAAASANETKAQALKDRVRESEPVEKAAAVSAEPATKRSVSSLNSQIQRDAFASLSTTAFDTDLFGRVSVSADLESWLAKEKGHIELYLQPLQSRDPQGTRFLSFHFPQDSFRESAEVLRGRYRLVAGVFRPGDIDSPHAEIVYPEEINAQTARSQIKFFLSAKDFKLVSSPGSGERNRVKVFISLFQGAAAEYDTPTSIVGAEVRVLGFPEYGTLLSNAEGNLEIPQFPSHSQAIIEVRAKGYYRTFRTVPVFGGDVHVPVYMVQKKQVALLSSLVQAPQNDHLSVAMGRVFDPETRNPLSGQTVLLKDQPSNRGHYFQFFGLPDASRTTASTGFYSDFNIQPTFRYWLRPQSEQRTFRMHVEASAGYYTELGRGGSKSFFGRLLDANGGKVVGASVWLVGDEAFEAISGEDGVFEIPGIDFPSGVIAIDVKAAGYRLTRHTVEWNPRQAAATKDLFMVKEHFVEQGLELAKSRRFGPEPRQLQAVGNIIGGAYGSLFQEESGCLEVELWSSKLNRVVDSGHGPYPLVGGGERTCINQSHPGFTYINLAPAEYLLKWKSASGEALGSRVIHVGMDRDSISVN